MKVAEATWQEVGAFSSDSVVLIPTGSLEQHGPHLPLITDTIIVTAVAEAIERRMSDRLVLLPTIWAGASAHHLTYPGSVSASFATYMAGITELIESYQRHGYKKFLILNGHGGNSDPNRMVLREAKMTSPNQSFSTFSYFELIVPMIAEILTGPLKQMRHACEAETSLMLHLRPELVRFDKARDDGMKPEPPLTGINLNFDELSEEGSVGYATCATSEKGAALFAAAVEACCVELERLLNGFVMVSIGE